MDTDRQPASVHRLDDLRIRRRQLAEQERREREIAGRPNHLKRILGEPDDFPPSAA